MLSRQRTHLRVFEQWEHAVDERHVFLVVVADKLEQCARLSCILEDRELRSRP